jgi:hypothetical protein
LSLSLEYPKKLLGLIKMCLNETYSRVRTGKNLTRVLFKRPETRRCFITIAFQLCFGISRQEGPRETGRIETEWDISASGLC